MDNKILQQHLADSLAERANITKRKAEAFVRSFFEATEDALIRDGIVKVKGFGTTKIISVSERESVNINTGERFQIESHDKITFTPDANFRDLVNRPFAHFTTIVLEDTVDETELATEVVDESEDVAPLEEETSEDKATIVEEQITEETSVEKQTPEEVTVEEQATTENVAEPCPVAETETEHTVAPKLATLIINEEPLIEIPEETISDDGTAPSDQPENETDMSQQPIIIQNSMPTPPSHNWWKTAFIVLITIVLMVLSYFAGYYRIFCPCDTAATVTYTDTTVQKKDTATVAKAEKQQKTEKHQKAEAEKLQKAETEKQQKAEEEKNAAAKYKQMGGEYLITGVLEHHTMKAGDNLYKLAYKAYGDKKLATYIIFHNNLENPDVIGLGQTIEIPKLTKK